MSGYDYGILAEHRKLLAFYVGWTGQKACYLTHGAGLQGTQEIQQGLTMWRQAAGETDRLLLLSDAWRRGAGRSWPDELSLALLSLVEDYDEEAGWWSSEGARSTLQVYETVEDMPLEDLAEGYVPFWPFLDVEVLKPSYWRAAGLVHELAKTVKLLGQSIGSEDALRYGVRLGGLFYCSAVKDPRGLAEHALAQLSAIGIGDRGAAKGFNRFIDMLPSDPAAFLSSGSESIRHSHIHLPSQDTGQALASFRTHVPGPGTDSAVYLVEGYSEEIVHAALRCVFGTSRIEAPSLVFDPAGHPELTDLKDELLHALAGSETRANNVFWRSAEFWRVRFRGGEEKLFQHKAGMPLLAHLLRHQGEEFPPEKLEELTDTAYSRMSPTGRAAVSPQDALEDGLRVPGSLGEVADEEAMEGYEERLKEIREERAKAAKNQDAATIESLDQQAATIRRYYHEGMGRRGQLRHFPDPQLKKARDRVVLSLKRVLTSIEDNYSDLGKHLCDYIGLGKLCRYAPQEDISWHVKTRDF